MRVRPWLVAATAAASATVLLVSGIAIATHVAGHTTVSGTAIQAVKVVRSTQANATTAAAPVDLPGATTTIRVPRDTRALILVRFSAESYCFGGAAGNWCVVEIDLNGNEGQPADGDNFAFDTSGAADDFWEAHSIDRSFGPLNSGTYTVNVRYYNTDGVTDFRLDDWSLTVERVRK